MIDFDTDSFMNYFCEKYPEVYTWEFATEWLENCIDYCKETALNEEDFYSALCYIIPRLQKSELEDYVSISE